MQMRVLGVVALISCVGLASSASAQSPWSPEKYKSADGWVWNPSTGMWRNPKPTLDRSTNQWVHQERHPSSTGCCDRTGLSFPAGAVNSFETYDKPTRSNRAQRRQDPRAVPAAPAGTAGAPTEDDIERIKQSNLHPEVKEQTIKRLQASQRRSGRGRASEPANVDYEEGGGSGAAANLYGSMGQLSAGQLEGMAQNRRRDPSTDPGVLDIVGAGLGAGMAIGQGIRAGRANSIPSSGTPSNRMGSYAPNREAFQVQQRRPPPSPLPRGNNYDPYRSSISGIGN